MGQFFRSCCVKHFWWYCWRNLLFIQIYNQIIGL